MGALARPNMGTAMLMRLLAVAGVLLLGPTISESTDINATDLQVLWQLKSLYAKRVNLSSWVVGNNCSAWKYIGCEGPRATGLYFQGTQLGGPFPSFITNLVRLRWLYMDSNNFTGTIPDGLSTLPRLQAIRLAGNLLSGSLPASLSKLPNLYKFFVNQNWRLNGTIPSSWSALNLQEAYFDSNSFSGPIPTVICSWSILQKLRIGNNRWTGSIPSCLGTLTNLVNLYLDNIGLTGNIPNSLTALTNLQLLFMNGNQLTGPIPKNIGNMKALSIFFISGNNVTGPLPISMGKLKNITDWVMEFNAIDGTIPTEIGNMPKLRRILLDNNRLTGPIPSSIGNLKNVTILLLEGNSLSGTIPPEIPRGCKSLVQFNVESNWLSGFPPTGFSSPNLIQINIRSNYFTGKVDYRTTSGDLICPPPKITDWIHSSSAFNCLTANATCGPKYVEIQRPAAHCANFCGANGPRGACNGNGRCYYTTGAKGKRVAVCKCKRGYVLTRNKLSCVARRSSIAVH